VLVRAGTRFHALTDERDTRDAARNRPRAPSALTTRAAS